MSEKKQKQKLEKEREQLRKGFISPEGMQRIREIDSLLSGGFVIQSVSKFRKCQPSYHKFDVRE